MLRTTDVVTIFKCIHALLRRSVSAWADSRCKKRWTTAAGLQFFTCNEKQTKRSSCQVLSHWEGADVTVPAPLWKRSPTGLINLLYYVVCLINIFYFLYKAFAWVEIVFCMGLWIHNDQGHSRQCPSLRCIKHYLVFFFLSNFSLNVRTDFVDFSLYSFSTPDKRSRILVCAMVCFPNAVNEEFTEVS